MLPTVHYNMGGLQTNYHGEVVTLKNGDPDTVVPGLYSIGEAACVSVHGANRLGSNSLLDLVVFGRAVANRCAETIKPGMPHKTLPAIACDKSLANFDKLRNANGGTPTAEIRDNMQHTMQNDAAVFRTGETLQEGVQKIPEVFTVLRGRQGVGPLAGLELRPDRDHGTAEPARPGGGHDGLGGEPQGIARRACARGFRRTRDDVNWMKHTLCWVDEKGRTQIDYRPVHLTR